MIVRSSQNEHGLSCDSYSHSVDPEFGAGNPNLLFLPAKYGPARLSESNGLTEWVTLWNRGTQFCCDPFQARVSVQTGAPPQHPWPATQRVALQAPRRQRNAPRDGVGRK